MSAENGYVIGTPSDVLSGQIPPPSNKGYSRRAQNDIRLTTFSSQYRPLDTGIM